MIPVLLEAQYRSRDNYEDIATLFTIHNFRFMVSGMKSPEVKTTLFLCFCHHAKYYRKRQDKLWTFGKHA